MTDAPLLTKRASSILDRLKRLQETALLANEGDRVRTRADELSRPLSDLESLQLVDEGLRERGLEPQVDRESIRATHTQLLALATRYRADPSQITAPDGRLRFTLWDPLKTLPDELRRSLLDAWRDHVAALVPRQRPEILDVLERVPGVQAEARALREIGNEFDRRSNALPQNNEDFDRIEGLATEIQTRWRTLEGAGIPAEVMNFLAAASLGSARLDLLTPTVRAWLDERSLTQHVRVTLSPE